MWLDSDFGEEKNCFREKSSRSFHGFSGMVKLIWLPGWGSLNKNLSNQAGRFPLQARGPEPEDESAFFPKSGNTPSNRAKGIKCHCCQRREKQSQGTGKFVEHVRILAKDSLKISVKQRWVHFLLEDTIRILASHRSDFSIWANRIFINRFCWGRIGGIRDINQKSFRDISLSWNL